MYLLASDFLLPSVSVVVGETIELLKEDKELVGRSVVLVKGYTDTESVLTQK